MGSAASVSYDTSDILFYSNKERLLQKLKYLDSSITDIPQSLIVSQTKWFFIDLNDDLLASTEKIYNFSLDFGARSAAVGIKNDLFPNFD
jgi:hypothetical protein